LFGSSARGSGEVRHDRLELFRPGLLLLCVLGDAPMRLVNNGTAGGNHTGENRELQDEALHRESFPYSTQRRTQSSNTGAVRVPR
jgi:hypothetical protein